MGKFAIGGLAGCIKTDPKGKECFVSPAEREKIRAGGITGVTISEAGHRQKTSRDARTGSKFE